MKSNYEDVKAFMDKFGLVTPMGPNEHGRNQEFIDFRIKFMQEELDEFIDAYGEHDEAGMADALIDLVYVAIGTAYRLGYPWQELWDEVQRANMSKERAAADGSNSKRGTAYDVIKPEGWHGPDIQGVLDLWGFET